MLLLKSAIAVLLAAPLFGAEGVPTPANVVAHEWGTFTSIAGPDGNPVPWKPLDGPSDLPSFVIRGQIPKMIAPPCTVRMETPVIYFYSPRPATLSVYVAFPKGLITEFYPPVTADAFSRVSWKSIQISPGDDPTYPTEKGASHYYAARATDAAPLNIGGKAEKMIFYRGVGDFSVPVRPRFVDDHTIEIANAGSERIPAAILFENRGGKIGFRMLGALDSTITTETPELTGDLDALRGKLAGILTEFGLYPKEARAMVETWRDSWFDEGMRLFYIVPRSTVDSVLPLTIEPAPASTARVFVGRVEVLSPAMRQTITAAQASHDTAALHKYGRFLEPFLAQMKK